jgi:cyclase
MKIARSGWLFALSVALGAGGWAVGADARQNQRGGEALEVLQVQPNFYMIAGAGGNIAVQIGPDGVVLVDAGSAAAADQVVAAVKRLTDQPVRYIINTSADADHVGGNERVARAGVSLFAAGNLGPGGGNTAINNGGAASIVGTEKVLLRMSAPTGQQALYPSTAWPTETFTRKQKNLYLNREGIEVISQPAAHTDGDSIVLFRRSDVLVTGDIFDTTRFPVIDVERGGSIQGEIDALNRIVDLAIPSIPLPFQDGGTQVVPGHGRISEQAEAVEYRDMVTVIRDVVEDMIKRGMTLEQIRAASPTKGYTRRYGSSSGPWTTNNFVDAVYKSLTSKK